MEKKNIAPEAALKLYAYVIATKYEIDKSLDEIIEFLDNSGFKELAAEAAAKAYKGEDNDGKHE